MKIGNPIKTPVTLPNWGVNENDNATFAVNIDNAFNYNMSIKMNEVLINYNVPPSMDRKIADVYNLIHDLLGRFLYLAIKTGLRNENW